jgi:hypothetical protein
MYYLLRLAVYCRNFVGYLVQGTVSAYNIISRFIKEGKSKETQRILDRSEEAEVRAQKLVEQVTLKAIDDVQKAEERAKTELFRLNTKVN